jgi:hypothetical protein
MTFLKRKEKARSRERKIRSSYWRTEKILMATSKKLSVIIDYY